MQLLNDFVREEVHDGKVVGLADVSVPIISIHETSLIAGLLLEDSCLLKPKFKFLNFENKIPNQRLNAHAHSRD